MQVSADPHVMLVPVQLPKKEGKLLTDETALRNHDFELNNHGFVTHDDWLWEQWNGRVRVFLSFYAGFLIVLCCFLNRFMLCFNRFMLFLC